MASWVADSGVDGLGTSLLAHETSPHVMQVNSEEWLAVAKPQLHPSSIFQDPSQLLGLDVSFLLPGYKVQQQALDARPDDDLNGRPYWQQHPEGRPSDDPRPDLLQPLEHCTVLDVKFFLFKETDNCTRAIARVWLHREDEEVVCPGGDFSKPVRRISWTTIDIHASLGLPEFLIAKERFDKAVHMKCLHGEEVQVWWHNLIEPTASQWCNGNIFVDPKGKDPCTIWGGIRVIFKDGSSTRCSAWEVRKRLLPIRTSAAAVAPNMPSLNIIGREALQAALKNAQPALKALHPTQIDLGSDLEIADLYKLPLRAPQANIHNNLEGCGSPADVAELIAELNSVQPANLPNIRVGPNPSQIAGGSKLTLGSVKSTGTLLRGRPGETPTSQPSGLLWDPMDTATGQVASPVALTPDGKLQPQDAAFSFDGVDGFLRHYAASKMPAYQGVKVMLTQEGVPAYMAFLGEPDGERPLGLYTTAEEAATARDEAILRQHGLASRPLLNHSLDKYQHVLAEFGLRRTADSDDLEESPLSQLDSPHWAGRASFLAHLQSLPAEPVASGPTNFPSGHVLPPQRPLSPTPDPISSEPEHTSKPPSPTRQDSSLQPHHTSEPDSDEQHDQVQTLSSASKDNSAEGSVAPTQQVPLQEEADVEEWVPAKGNKGKRTPRTRKRAAVTEAALHVVKTGSTSITKKKATQEVKRRAAKLAPFTGVTIKNNRLAAMVWDRSSNKPAHLGYWDCSLHAAVIADKGRLSLYGRRGVRDTDLNFPAETYSDAEIPGSIEQLQVFIKQDQAKGSQAAQHASARNTRRNTASAQPSQAPMQPMRWSHFIGVVWNADSGLWKALFKQADGEVKCLGSFANQKDAAVAYDTHAWRVEGAPGLRNHPPSHYTGNKADNDAAHPCLKLYAEQGEAWVHAHTNPGAAPKASKNTSCAPTTHILAAPTTQALTNKAPAADAPKAEMPAASETATAPENTGPSAAGTAVSKPRVRKQQAPAKPHTHPYNPEHTNQTARQAPYKGLHRVAGEAKWEVRIEVQGSIKLLGQYRDAREAATAHDAAVLVAGTDAPLNFPDEAIKVSAATQQSCVSLALHLRKSTALARSLPTYQVQDKTQQRNRKRAGDQVEQGEQVEDGVIGRRRPKRARKQVEEEDKDTSEVNKRPRKARKAKAADSAALRNARVSGEQSPLSTSELSPEEEEAAVVLRTLSSGGQWSL